MADEDFEEELQKPFAVERAKTGRAKCKKCKCPIDKDCVRLAKIMKNPFGDGTMKSWHHVNCLFEVFAKQRATTKRIDDPEEDISGWNELDEEDRNIVLEKLEEFNKNSNYFSYFCNFYFKSFKITKFIPLKVDNFLKF